MRKSTARIGPIALGCLALTCAACASGPGRGPAGSGGPGGGPPMAPGLFVSPFGEPFRSGPDEPYPVAAWFAGADADHDGRLTRAEFMADGVRWFDRLDVNRDGVIGQAEIVAYEAMAGQLGGMGGPGGEMHGPGGPRGGWGGRPGGVAGGGASLADTGQDGGMGMPGGGMGGPRGGRGGPGGMGEGPHGGPRGGMAATSLLAMAGLLNVPEPVKAADVDVNQRITPEEWARAGDRWFNLLDADRDGALTLAELPKTGLQEGGGLRRGRRR